MSLFDRIRQSFGGKPKLRNKPGGLAWINSKAGEGGGTEVLVNRVVRTVRLKYGDMWEIDPPQTYVATRYLSFTSCGAKAKPGDRITADGLRDNALTPIEGDVTDEEVRELFAPPVPNSTKETA